MILRKHTTRWNPDFASTQTIHTDTKGHFVSIIDSELEVVSMTDLRQTWHDA
jgi:hypothetical protein